MEIKRVIEIEEDILKRIDEAKSVPDMFGTDIVNGLNAIKYSKPYDEAEVWRKSNELLEKRLKYLGNTQGDCISHEALKEQINATDFDFGDYYDNTEEIRKRVCEAIDNAQVVEPFTQLEKKEIAAAIRYLLGAELLEENGYTEEVKSALRSALKKVGGQEE